MTKLILNAGLLLISSAFLFTNVAEAQSAKLYIQRGEFTTIDSNSFTALAFNETTQFDPANHVVDLNTNENFELTVFNYDSVTHEIAAEGKIAQTVAAGDSVVFNLKYNKPGTYSLYSTVSNSKYLGLSTIIAVHPTGNHAAFYWNIASHDIELSKNIAQNPDTATNWQQYEPNYYTINGKSFPELQNDSSAVIHGKAGDTMYIFVLNSGQSMHSIHFHGYHCKVVSSKNKQTLPGTSKDTFPLDSNETLLLELVPDKPGIYPVHDHNLIATTGGNQHSNGMIIHMSIQ